MTNALIGFQPPAAVATGVGEAIMRDYENTPQGWIDYALTAALEAYEAVKEGAAEGHDEDDQEYTKQQALEASKAAFRCCLPPLTSRAAIRCLIATITVGAARGLLSTKDANALLFGAQAALAAWPKRTARKGGKAQA